jgi:hypothetical protein
MLNSRKWTRSTEPKLTSHTETQEELGQGVPRLKDMVLLPLAATRLPRRNKLG